MNFNMPPVNNRPEKKKYPRALIMSAGVLLAVLIALATFSPFVTIPSGHTGVITTFGSVSDHIINEGLHLKNPVSNIIIMDTREQKKTETLQAFSKDIQQVDVIVTVTFNLDEETAQVIYQSVGIDYYDKVMVHRIQELVKSVFTKYSAEKLIEVRENLSREIKELLTPEMKVYGISVRNVSVEDIDFASAFTDAVEAKQVAEQTKLKVETEQAMQVSVETSTAERRIIAARADAEEREILAQADAAVVKIDAEAKAHAVTVQADAEAEANKKIAASITNILIDYEKIRQWNGRLPEIYAGDGALPILDLMSGASAAR
jgi:regulator of protease activity HflC (stomatin/prohibitin superfamily)